VNRKLATLGITGVLAGYKKTFSLKQAEVRGLTRTAFLWYNIYRTLKLETF
jgi:hypothetical protein